MKVSYGSIVLLIFMGLSVPIAVNARFEKYKHKSEAEIARMTPAQRVALEGKIFHEPDEASLGFVRVDAVNDAPFDPNIHEAVIHEASDAHREGEVMQQLQRGYMLGETASANEMKASA